MLCVFCRTFRIMDDDASHSLEYAELAKGINDYGLMMDKERIKELFQTLDKDNSGSVSFDEFLQALRVSFANEHVGE